MGETHRVLIVEDDVQIAELLTDALLDEGYEVHHAAHGGEGLAILKGWIPKVIILDLMMPFMDGRAFRAAQRRLPDPVGKVPAIVLSGAHDARTRAEELAALAVLPKPFDLDEVLQTVAEACQAH